MILLQNSTAFRGNKQATKIATIKQYVVNVA